VLEVHPDDASALDLLLRNDVAGGLLRDAERVAERMLADGPATFRAHAALASIFTGRGWTAEAEAHAAQAVRAKPGDPLLHRQLASLRTGRTATLEALQEGLARTGDPDLLHRTVRTALATEGADLAHLTGRLRAALTLNPYAKDNWLLLRDCHVYAKAPVRALEALDKALAYLPDDPDLLEARGRLQLQTGDREAALLSWRTALGRAPDNPRLRDYLKTLAPEDAAFYDPYSIPTETVLSSRVDPADPRYARHNTVVLLDQGVVRAKANGTADMMIHFVRQALTQQGAESLAGYAVGFDPERKRVEVLAAKVHQPDGSVLSATRIEDREGSKGGEGGIYSRWHYKAIQLPEVRPGSIVEIKYVMEATGENLYGDDFEDGFFFGSEDPTLHFQYVLDCPDRKSVV